MEQFTFHLIPNAHLDPVWLWDWREGLNEGIITCRAVLDMMDEDPELTFVRGEATIYRHIEKTDPETFARIKKYVRAGRWDVVGGTEIQPDTNLPATETFCRHYLHGKQYFRDNFNKNVTVGWAADSFGHTGGMPEILTACGIDSFCFCRPAYDIVPIEKSAFWWEGFGGTRVLAYRPRWGWYGAERGEMPERLDQLLAEAQRTDLSNIAVLFGLGNHGGGPSRRQIDDIRRWGRKHPQVKLQFSGLHKFFAALRREVATGRELPIHKGELNFVLRGCYSSVAKFKFLYRRAENQVQRAEIANTVIAAGAAAADRQRQEQFRAAWDAILFNSFHDILPGSSIERAFDEQINWIGGAIHAARLAEFDALNQLATQIDTRVAKPKQGDHPAPAALLVWNPLPRPFAGYIELETNLDYRPIWEYQKRTTEFPLKVIGANGKPLPFQTIAEEHRCMPGQVWRRRIVAPLSLPAMGWNVIQMGWVEGFKPAVINRPTIGKSNTISNHIYEIRAIPGQAGVHIRHRGRDLFGKLGLHAITVNDPWGSWGGMAEEKNAIILSDLRETWRITQSHLLETGPLRATLWVRFEAGQSRLDLSFMLCRDRQSIDVRARLLVNERSARIKLVFPGCDQAEFDVPAGRIMRGPVGQVPGGRWVRAFKDAIANFGLATDAIYDFDIADNALRATICRASRYADDIQTQPGEVPWRPAVDSGELKFNFLICPGDGDLEGLADQLHQPPVSILVPSHSGQRKKAGSLASVSPARLQLLALKPAEHGGGLILRLFNRGPKVATPVLATANRKLNLTPLPAGKIGTWRIETSGQNLRAAIITADEPKRRRK